jgi:hypothetical protein
VRLVNATGAGSRYSGAAQLRALWNASQTAGSPQTIPLVDVRSETPETWTLLTAIDWQIPNSGPQSIVTVAGGGAASPSDLPLVSLVWDEGGDAFTLQDDSRTEAAPLWRGLVVALHGKSPRAWGMFPGTGPGATTVECAIKSWIVPRAPRIVERVSPLIVAGDYATWLGLQTAQSPRISSVIPWWAQTISIHACSTNTWIPISPVLEFRDPTGSTIYGAATLPANNRIEVAIPPEARYVYVRDPLWISAGQCYATFRGIA